MGKRTIIRFHPAEGKGSLDVHNLDGINRDSAIITTGFPNTDYTLAQVAVFHYTEGGRTIVTNMANAIFTNPEQIREGGSLSIPHSPTGESEETKSILFPGQDRFGQRAGNYEVTVEDH
jgi:hypothetical protein